MPNGAMVWFNCCRCILLELRDGGFHAGRLTRQYQFRGAYPCDLMPRYYFLGNVSRSSLNSVRGEAKLTLPKANPCCHFFDIENTRQPPGRPFPLGRWTAVRRVCCECSSFQCELDAPSGAGCMGRISHEPYLRPVDFQEWYAVYKQMIQHCHIVAVASSPSDILGLIWHFPATLHSWNLTWTRKVVWMERKSFFHDS